MVSTAMDMLLLFPDKTYGVFNILWRLNAVSDTAPIPNRVYILYVLHT